MSDIYLQGEFYHSIDAKRRLAIPAKFRELLVGGYVITRSLRDGCLEIYPKAEWEKYVASFDGLPSAKRKDIYRFLNRCAVSDAPDAQGRVLLNDTLLKHAAITKDVVVMGAGNKIEIWSEESYDTTVIGVEDESCRIAVEYLDRMEEREALGRTDY